MESVFLLPLFPIMSNFLLTSTNARSDIFKLHFLHVASVWLANGRTSALCHRLDFLIHFFTESDQFEGSVGQFPENVNIVHVLEVLDKNFPLSSLEQVSGFIIDNCLLLNIFESMFIIFSLKFLSFEDFG